MVNKILAINKFTIKDVDDGNISNNEMKSPRGFGVRHLQTLLIFFCLTFAYALRVNLSVAIVAMTDRNHTNPDFEEYKWNESTQSFILSSFFWGYVLTQVPAGQLAQKYGPKIILLCAMLICSLLNLLTPLAASLGDWHAVCALRVVQGLCQGFIFPSTHTLLSKWAPVSERGKLGTYSYAGSQFGTVIMLSSSGVLASSALGWPSIFYISGFCGILWSIAWFFYGGNSPNEYKKISNEEREFIESSLCNKDMKKLKTPWLSIITSGPFIALLIVHCTHNWGFWTLLTEMPTYMKNILGLDIKKNALLSALPYLVMWLLSFFISALADFLSKRNLISLNVSRKLFNSIGHWVPMCALIGLSFVTGSIELAVGLLTLAVGFNSSAYLGFQVNHIDLSPNFAGTLMGMTNCAANIMSIIAPLVVGFIVTDGKNPAQWRIVFFIASGFYLIGNLLFIIFGKTDIQYWNEPKRKNSLTENGNATQQNNAENQI